MEFRLNPEILPKFTVIIPTKDRAEYLRHTLRTCSIQDYGNLDVVVCDDGSEDNTREVVEAAARVDSRIRYVSPGRNVGMLDNFEFALDHVEDGYVIALGGDDALLPYGISRMQKLLKQSGQEMLAWSTPAFFYPKVKMKTGQFIYPMGSRKAVDGYRIVDSDEFLARQSKDLLYLGDIESPMFYVKGVVSTELVKKVKRRSLEGRFYSCPTPDGYSGIVLAGEVESWAFSDTPFSMHGVSPTSQGNAYLSSDPKHTRQSEQFFKHAMKRPMHRELASQPYSPLISVMTADYLLTARDLDGWPGKYVPIDFRALLEKAVSELADGLFAHEKVARELVILFKIAEFYDLGEWFREFVSRKVRNSRSVLEGNAISPDRIYLNAEQFGIENVFDAAYAAYNISHFRHEVKPRFIYETFKSSLIYKLMSFKKGQCFPPESEWVC